MAKPRILVSGHLPPPMGGMATFYETLLGSSLSTRVDLRFVQTSSQDRELLKSGKFTIRNLVGALQDCLRFASAVRSYRPQLCHIGTGAGLSFLKHGICVVIARAYGIRVLLQPHCSFAAVFAERSRAWRWIFTRIIRWTNGVLALSNEWQQLSGLIPNRPIYYMPNPVSLKEYQGIARQHLEESKQHIPFRILYMGHLGETKGTFDLIRAAQEVSSRTLDVVFDLVGGEMQPGNRHKLQGLIDQNHLTCVALYPPVSGIEKMRFFTNADMFVYPSYYEGMPMSVLEAMACALPIVATRVGGLPDIVKQGVNGLLVTVGQPQELAGAIYQLYLNHELYKEMQQQSYRYAREHHDVEDYVSELIDIYKKTLLVGRVPEYSINKSTYMDD